MLYSGYHFLGMHLAWWLVWSCLLLWIFVTPYKLPGQRFKEKSPDDILRERFALGQITAQEYEDMTEVVEKNEQKTTIFDYYLL